MGERFRLAYDVLIRDDEYFAVWSPRVFLS